MPSCVGYIHHPYWYSLDGSALLFAFVDVFTHFSEIICCPFQLLPLFRYSSPNFAKSIARALMPLSIFSKPLALLSRLQDAGASVPSGFHSLSSINFATGIPVARSRIIPSSK